ncbi:MAG: hypothetical protein DRH04_01890 [Deltaproteobacteria bacterium]|nr:MAG: hypothetical protein DRH04_01890 [Deltaproteobacteria bacterium]
MFVGVYREIVEKSLERAWENLKAAHSRFDQIQDVMHVCDIRFPVWKIELSSQKFLQWPLIDDNKKKEHQICLRTKNGWIRAYWNITWGACSNAEKAINDIPLRNPSDVYRVVMFLNRIASWFHARSEGLERHAQYLLKHSKKLERLKDSLILDELAKE